MIFPLSVLQTGSVSHFCSLSSLVKSNLRQEMTETIAQMLTFTFLYGPTEAFIALPLQACCDYLHD